jgi:hypothetical protein
LEKQDISLFFDTSNTIRFHPDPKMGILKQKRYNDKLGPDFVKSMKQSLAGQDNGGYYQWP